MTGVNKLMTGINKPNWSLVQLFEKSERYRALTFEVGDHDHDCDCEGCMELFGLDALLETFDEDEMAGAVIEANKKELQSGDLIVWKSPEMSDRKTYKVIALHETDSKFVWVRETRKNGEFYKRNLPNILVLKSNFKLMQEVR